MAKQKMKIPKSVKTYIRREKARIRKIGMVQGEQKKFIDELYQNLGFAKQHED